MNFLDRHGETGRLYSLLNQESASFGIIWGRRRVGKTRLLTEWVRKTDGLYVVADQSAEPVQRRYFAQAVAALFEGFAEVEYPDWRALLRALARAASQKKWQGPLVIDEFPYLVSSSPALSSIMQAFIDHEARSAKLVVVLSGSSQHMMQGLALERSSPLFGRSSLSFELLPLPAGFIGEALDIAQICQQLMAWSLWGGIPRYWELAAQFGVNIEKSIEMLVLDPSGPLHNEPDRLLAEESPSAIMLRPILDTIGAGAHRPSEIAGRMGTPATSLTRPLGRLQELGFIAREQPFGESERNSKRSLYRIRDPFTRLWFSVVAANRAALAMGSPESRLSLWLRKAEHLFAEAWEELCRLSVPFLHNNDQLSSFGPWGPAGRYWKGTAPEFDVVSISVDGQSLLLGEVKWASTPFTDRQLDEVKRNLLSKGSPREDWSVGKRIVYALFVPDAENGLVARANPNSDMISIINGGDVLKVLR